MAQVQLPNSLKRILIITLSLIFISVAVVIIIGESLKNINKEIKQLENFVNKTEEIQPNFEKSLEMYTVQTKHIIEFLSELRPSNEEDIVKALSEIENIGQKLSLNIELSSLGKGLNENNADKTLNYDISFYGSLNDLQNFLKEMENLMYFIRIKKLEFRDTKYMDADEIEREKNIKFNIILYTK